MDEYLQPTFCVYVITYPSHNLNAGMANICSNNRSQVGKNSEIYRDPVKPAHNIYQVVIVFLQIFFTTYYSKSHMKFGKSEICLRTSNISNVNFTLIYIYMCVCVCVRGGVEVCVCLVHISNWYIWFLIIKKSDGRTTV